MAKDYIQRLLGENERIQLVTRQHWFVLFSNILLEILLIVLLVLGSSALTVIYPIASAGFILVLVPLIGMIRDILIWSNREYIVTNRRVIQISGVFDKNVVDSSLEKVNDVKMSQSFLGRMFDYGDIEILTASELGINLFRRIGEPIKFKTAMLNAKEELGFGEIGARPQAEEDIPTLIAKLDGLRKQNIISEAEFQKKKAELLAKL
jgi:uncharacterized membrane protein YdbT with pleckstrin-like domain